MMTCMDQIKSRMNIGFKGGVVNVSKESFIDFANNNMDYLSHGPTRDNVKEVIK